MINVLAIVPYHLDYCAGQRFRIELWAKEMSKREINIDFLSFTEEELTDVLYQNGKNVKKASMLIKAFMKQIAKLFRVKKPDVIFIYREAAVAGPAIIENIVRKWNIPIIYDIDEPLFVPYVSPSSGAMSKLKFFSKIDKIIAKSDTVFAVNHPIAEHAKKLNNNVHIVPMTVDTKRYKPNKEKQSNKSPIITWVGTRTNQPNIELASPALKKLGETHEFSFRIIADDPMNINGVDVEFIPWKYDIEVPSLQQADIGITPVMESVWSPWKFFFKTIQYMSLGMPVIGSETGSNIGIIENGVNGFLVKNDEEWYSKLKLLVENPDLRAELGHNARETVLERFTLEKQFAFVEKQIREAALQKPRLGNV